VFGDRALSFLKDRVRLGTSTRGAQPTGQVERLCLAVLDATAETLRFGQSEALEELARRTDALQLALLSQALRDLSRDPTAAQAMRVSYLSTQGMLAA
jgi:hypothetical protein